MRFMLDENIPASVARMLVANGHHAEFIRDHVPPGSADPVVATVSQDIGAVLVSFDGDFQKLAARVPKGQRRRFRRFIPDGACRGLAVWRVQDIEPTPAPKKRLAALSRAPSSPERAW